MKTILAAILCLMAAAPGHAATTLLDFESQADLARLPYRSRGKTRLETVPEFATDGRAALRFSTPAWRKGMPEWPSFEMTSPVRDWSPFDRLMVDVTNPGADRHFFSLMVSDSKVPVRQGLIYRFELPSRGYKRFLIPLSSFPKNVNRADVAVLHFFTQRPASDFALHLDNLTLLKRGESAPDPGPDFARQLVPLSRGQLAAAEKALAETQRAAESPGAGKQFAKVQQRLDAIRAELDAPSLTVARLSALDDELGTLPQKAQRVVSIARFQQACRAAGHSESNMLVGMATSMEKVLPRDAAFNIVPARPIELRLARNEKESIQVAVLPAADALRKVSVSASDLKSAEGAVFLRKHIECDVVGYVETKKRPPYDVPHVGWWPDPILSFLGPVDVAAGDVQTFWIRFVAPKDQSPGVYRGTLTVAAENAAPQTLAVTLRVYPFTLPDYTPLPLAITFAPHDSPLPETSKEQAAWSKTDEYPLNAWKKQKLRWADMLADYYISYDSLYHREMPDFEVLEHLHRQGRLGAFNLGYYSQVGPEPGDVETWKARHLPRLRKAYAKAKELGLLDHAYLYGCDEAKPDLFGQVQQAATILKAEFPGVPITTTTYDQGYGMDSVIRAMDGFCPLTPKFDPDKAAKARAAGKAVWWYICCGPHHPYANMFLEYPAIEGRLLMGAMTVKQRPEAFLYYQISIWNSRRPITSGPFTDWEPRSWTTYHGDGSWTCVGPGGSPVPTIRLENFRDGLEDYAYAAILEAIVRQRERAASPSAEQQKWLADARAALKVPESVVRTMTEYSREPAALYAWRDRLGDLIERSGSAQVNPWGKPFSVRR